MPNMNATAPFLIGLHKFLSFWMNCNTDCDPGPIAGSNTVVESLPRRLKCGILANESVNACYFEIA